MPRNFHEQFDRQESPLPSDRSTGLVFAGVALVAAYVWRAHGVAPYVALGVAAVLASVSLVAPRVIRPLNIVWMRFALILGAIVNPVIMMVLFAILIVPAGLMMQTRRDPLRRTRQPGAKSYWLERKPEEHSSMANQF